MDTEKDSKQEKQKDADRAWTLQGGNKYVKSE
jgi:hypothetical protein